ncbi:MAG: Stp1/IreP family PP2C-type Ser/Thr phosphatase [Cyanobacteria bacterium NC_groundwater_1444_Ag_S-0.65um_54_12]|nr:Stp1/IreP family PP2C-type Ser/Thr phosphatase [Cyanobacteria bacterium NC_groundwater_1444_Ag_S-0.65um_54_12]
MILQKGGNRTLRLGCLTDVGKVRDINQDCFATSLEHGLLMVADGMGGHLAGEKAAQSAVDIITAMLTAEISHNGDMRQLIRQAIQEANRQIVQASLQDSSMRGMGTTATVAMTIDDMVHIGHVGDSRAYLLREGTIEQITEDHSVVAQLLKAGAITSQEAANHPYRNVITRCLGMQTDVEADTISLPFRPGESLLLCTDGLSGLVSDDELLKLASEARDPQDACQKMLELAIARGGYDNVTVVLLHYQT